MDNDTLGWLPAALAEGQPAQAHGTLIRLGTGFCITPPGGNVTLAGDEIVKSVAPAVPLRAGVDLELESFSLRQVTATGRLEDRALFVDRIDVIADDPDVEFRRQADNGIRPRPAMNVLPRSPQEQALFREGQLLDLWPARDARRGQTVAVVTDDYAVRAVLAPLYGTNLTLVRARWTQQVLNDIEAVLAATGLVQSIGRRRTHDDQVQVAAVLLYIPPQLPDRLARFPRDAVRVASLIHPA